MERQEITKRLIKNIELLTDNSAKYDYIPQQDNKLPDVEKLEEIVSLVKNIIFPGYFDEAGMTTDTQRYYIGTKMERLYELLAEQICCGMSLLGCCHSKDTNEVSVKKALEFIDNLSELKRLSNTDVKAVFDGDPAADSFEEIIFSYPVIKAMVHYRVAHLLLQLGVPVIPRIISEKAHSLTGIDIHPGAKIGEYFSIDHGTGVVIGETCIIGNHVRLYQGVTLGAKSFKYDNNGNIMNVPRHPILEDNVTVYSNSSILGRITIGHHSVIGGNVWQTTSVPPYSYILQGKATSTPLIDGAGI